MPFVTVDCNRLVPELIEREFFGHVGEVLGGARCSQEGVLSATEGTVFLDEIDALPLDLQAKRARALQDKEVRSIGEIRGVAISARVLAATSGDLAEMMAHGRFRKDLYIHLNIVAIKLPPLRERREDVADLAEHFLEKRNRDTGEPHTLSRDAVGLMLEYDWPGNVRELEYAIEHACSQSRGSILNSGDLPAEMQAFRVRGECLPAVESVGVPNDVSNRCRAVVPIAEMERHAILETISQLNGDKLMVARLLGIGKTTLYRKLKDYDHVEDKRRANVVGCQTRGEESKILHSAA